MSRYSINIFLLSMLCPCVLRAQSINDIVSQHVDYRLTISTISCDYRLEARLFNQRIGELLFYGKFYYHQPTDRTFIRDGKQGVIQSSRLIQNGIEKNLTRQWAPGGNSTLHVGLSPAAEVESFGNVFHDFSISRFRSQAKRFVDLDELYRSTGAKVHSRRVEEIVDPSGTKYRTIRVDYSRVYEKLTVNVQHWHCVDLSMLIVKRREQIELPSVITEEFITNIENINGVNFPTLRLRTITRDGILGESIRETISNININHDLPDSLFVLERIPSGTPCTDRITMTKYVVGSDWKPISDPEPFSLVEAAPVSSLSSSQPRQATTDEPKSWTYWVTVVSGGVFLTAFVVFSFLWLRGRIIRT